MKVLLTGGAGFIGSHVANRLVLEGYDVAIIDNLSSSSSENLPENVKFYHFDINDCFVEKIVETEKPNIVIHLAAQTSVVHSMKEPIFDFQTNTAATVKLLQYAVEYGVDHFLFASSAAVYGEPLHLPISEQHPVNPQSFYAVSKYAAERYIVNFAQQYNLTSTILRFSNVYGPKQNTQGEAGVVGRFISKIVEKENCIIYGGAQTRDFIYVKDIADAVLKAIVAKKEGIYNVSSNTEISIRQLYEMISEKLSSDAPPSFLSYRDGELHRSVLSNERARKELSWHPIYSISEGLDETINDFLLCNEFRMEGRYNEAYSNQYIGTITQG